MPLDAIGQEKHNAGWTLAFDNDLLSFADRDFDYTGGLAVTFAGRRAQQWWFSLDPIVGWLDPLLPAAALAGQPALPLHSLQAGLVAFTPDDLNSHDPLPLDRSYASLLFLSNSRTFVTDPAQPVYETSFTLGVLGWDRPKRSSMASTRVSIRNACRRVGITRFPMAASRRRVQPRSVTACEQLHLLRSSSRYDAPSSTWVVVGSSADARLRARSKRQHAHSIANARRGACFIRA